MLESELVNARIRAGRWDAELRCDAETGPELEVVHLDRPLDGVTVGAKNAAGRWPVSVPIPAALLSDGVQTFVIRDMTRDVRLGQFTIVTGVPLDDDIRAEIDLLRAELDMLKKAFRRHCLQMT